MQVFRSLESFKNARFSHPKNISTALVPTMGALHEGHLSLVQKAVEENDQTIVSIFVNPTQFGPNEDYEAYPRSLQEDVELLEKVGVDIIFAPDVSEIYPAKSYLRFEIDGLGDKLCAVSRPGHMEGVLQVVSILFHLTQPNKAYFGLKDYQQCLLIQRLVKELHFPLEVVPCPIIRENDGLAMSSRNAYLLPHERKVAPKLYQVLKAIKENKSQWENVEQAITYARDLLSNEGEINVDYIEILNGKDLSPISHFSDEVHPHIFIAAFVGKSRLIDNLSLTD